MTYLEKILKLNQERPILQQPGVHHIRVAHDEWCALLRGTGPCNCDPGARVRLGFAVKIFGAALQACRCSRSLQVSIISNYVNPPSPTKLLTNHDLLSCGVARWSYPGAKPQPVVVQVTRENAFESTPDTPLFVSETEEVYVR